MTASPTQASKAAHFKKLHMSDDPLILYNIWDAGSAKTVADAGAPAVATGSWSVAAAQGFKDGENLPLDFLLQIVNRICSTVDIPVSIDFEGGYATDAKALATNIHRLLVAGAIGINFEDRVVKGAGLHSIADQQARIRAIRSASDKAGVPLFINARTDVFLASKPDDHAGLVATAIERGMAYADAGADGFFIPGLGNQDLIKRITAASPLPVNIMVKDHTQMAALLPDAGVARVSFGPHPYRQAQVDLQSRFKAL